MYNPVDQERLESTSVLLALQLKSRVLRPLEAQELSAHGAGLTSREYEIAMDAVEKSWQLGIETIAIHESGYPALLAQIPQPPLVVFYKAGRVAEFADRPALALVGSRRTLAPIEHFTAALGEEAASGGLAVVSGLAHGIDSGAHQGALRGGVTWAVLAHGLDQIYPAVHRWLADQIIEKGGVLLSEYSPGTPPKPYQFLARNRIIAGLARASVIVQAARKSGALATARFALEFGREVFAVPGPAWDEAFAGSNQLLRDGATPLVAPEQIWDVFPEMKRVKRNLEPPSCKSSLEGELRELFEVVRTECEISYADLQQRLPGISIHKAILQLELEGFIERRPGNLVAAL